MATYTDQSALEKFRACMRGTVLAPGDIGYDDARKTWNLTINQHPALVANVAGVQDVVYAVNFARKHGLPIAVQSTGHGIAHPCNGGLLVNTSRMKGIWVHPQIRRAQVEAGALWGEVIHETQTFNLAPLSGFAPNVGVVGYTLGGGLGWLARKYGLAVDSLRSVDIVTADGRLLHASDVSNSDLFWGLKGGGGNFGIVTSLEFEVYPVINVYGGRLFYPAELAKEVLYLYSKWVETVPDELTSTISILHLPNEPSLPENLRGKSVIAVNACYLGSEVEGTELLRPFRELSPPLADTFAVKSYNDIGTITNDPVEPQRTYEHTELLKTLSTDVIEKLIEVAGVCSNSPLLMVELRHLGGAIARVPSDANAVAHRDSLFLLIIQSQLTTSQQTTLVNRYTDIVASVIRPYVTGGVFLNFFGNHKVDNARVKAVYSEEKYRRLVNLKNKYDPENFFRLNHNIQPSM